HRAVVVGSPPVDLHPDVPCVTGDHEQGGYLATRHLLDLGHRRIGYARFNPSSSLIRTSRWRGHQRAVRQAEREGKSIEARLLDGEMLAAWSAAPQLA